MRLLIITQKVDKDDSYFGFFHSWLEYFSKYCESITVIALERRAFDLPENVSVLTLGKESKKSRAMYLLHFWKYAYQYRDEYDAVFCHMSPLYVIAGFPIWKFLGKPKKIALWYLHRHVDLKLRISEKLTDIVFTASPESFRIDSPKRRFMRQAVDIAQFARPDGYKIVDKEPTLVSVGRLTPIKNLEILISAAHNLVSSDMPLRVRLIGAAVTDSDAVYAQTLHEQVDTLDIAETIQFEGSKPFRDIREAYWESAASVNLCPTGGMDKAVLESLAAGTIALVSNTAFAPLMSGYEDRLIFKERDADDLMQKLRALLTTPDREAVAKELQERVRKDYSLDALIRNIIATLSTYEVAA